MKKAKEKQALKIILGAIAVVWLLSFLLYRSKFWYGLAGVFTVPLLTIAFLIEAKMP